MNLSMKWLAQYVDCGVTVPEFCSGMTMSGSKVETYTVEGADIENVVVGKVLEMRPHENSDHLWICQVDVGQDTPVQIVTGAQNVKEGALVPVALIGAKLPNGTKIKKSKLRGVESDGMLCSIGELGLTLHDFPYAVEDGIFLLEEDCKPGDDIQTAIGLNDTSVEFEITSNRPDCMSVVGLAREAAVTFQKPLHLTEPVVHGVEDHVEDMLSVRIDNPTLCPHYIAGVVKNVHIAPSPRWMRERLRASGVRPINNLVDITNYVMLEYGQPMHAFDLRYVEDSQIIVRNAKEGETITTLDGQVRHLTPEMLVIADAKKPIAVAGVMGGEYSGIMEDTQTVVFESAYFEPTQVRRTSKKLGMRTDASMRYEKGVNPMGCDKSLRRAMELVEELGAGQPLVPFLEDNQCNYVAPEIPFDPDWINKFLGTDIPREDMEHTLTQLDIQVHGDTCTPPSYRIDLERPADIAEEIARIYDYNNIPSTVIRGVADGQLTTKQKFFRTAERTMVGLGFHGILTYSFTSPKCFDRIDLPSDSPLRNAVTIANPLGEDTSIMRTTTLPSMLDTLAFNYNNRNDTVAFYERAREYVPTGADTLPLEPERLTIGMYGGDADFFSLKGVVEAICKALHMPKCTFVRPTESDAFPETCALHPGRSAVVLCGETPIGYLGEIHPHVQKNYGIGTRTYVAKLLLEEMVSLANPEITYQPLPKYPAVERDLSLVCDEEMPVGTLEQLIRDAAGDLLEDVSLFDVYKGDQIAAGKKSVSYSLRFRSYTETLTDEKADQILAHVLQVLEQNGVTLRT